MKTYINALRTALIAAVLALAALTTPVHAQNVIGNLTGTGQVCAANGALFLAQNNYTGYLTGTAYTLTTSMAPIVGGTTSPSVTITAPGTYLIEGNVMSLYNNATFAANQTESFQFFRTNNTATTISSTNSAQTLQIITTTTQSAGPVPVYAVIYTTTNSNDIITIQGQLSALPSGGSVGVTGAFIAVTRLY
jgi:hypothetical protein